MRWSLTDDYDERYFKDYDMVNLRMDEFYLNINASSLKEYYLYTLKRECFEVSIEVKTVGVFKE